MNLRFSLIFTVIATTTLISSASTDTPTITCQNPDKVHVKSGFTLEQKQMILDLHNEFRNKIAAGLETEYPQPKATNMIKMKWDNDIADMAQSFASKCEIAHSSAGDRNNTGENIAFSTYNTVEQINDGRISYLIGGFYREVKNMQDSIVDVFAASPSGQVGHYTQVVWHNSEKLGCGITLFEDPNKYAVIFCQYGPNGNFNGAPVYQKGDTPCSSCPDTYTCDATHTGLCSDSSFDYTVKDPVPTPAPEGPVDPNADPNAEPTSANIIGYSFIGMIGLLVLFI